MPGLYIHVPFCARKCEYCDFYSVPPQRDQIDSFLDALEIELRMFPDGFAPETIFIGGGTPSFLSPRQLARMLSAIKESVDCGKASEWSCEANPGSLDGEKVRLLHESGVNRISLGVQSFEPVNLTFLGRIHSAGEAVAAYELLREEGFKNVNIDLLYGIPGSSQAALERDLDKIVELGPEHVACYCLIFEEGTRLTKRRDAGEFAEVNDDVEREQYRLVRERLAEAGYRHYEISNFAKPGFECAHNLLYWSGGEYLGVGPSAHSHWHGVRRGNVGELAQYCARLLDGKSASDFEEKLEPEAKARETLVMSLRRLDGVDRAWFRETTGFDYRELRGREIDWLCGLGFLEERNDVVRLTERGLFVSDSVFAELV